MPKNSSFSDFQNSSLKGGLNLSKALSLNILGAVYLFYNYTSGNDGKLFFISFSHARLNATKKKIYDYV
jgi:hypothetical protein